MSIKSTKQPVTQSEKRQPATQSKKDLVNYLVSKNLRNSTIACIGCIGDWLD